MALLQVVRPQPYKTVKMTVKALERWFQRPNCDSIRLPIREIFWFEVADSTVATQLEEGCTTPTPMHLGLCNVLINSTRTERTQTWSCRVYRPDHRASSKK